MTTLANFVEEYAGGAFREPVGKIILGYRIGVEYALEIERLIGKDIPWSEARELLAVPFDSRHLPPFRVDTESWSTFVANTAAGWRISGFEARVG